MARHACRQHRRHRRELFRRVDGQRLGGVEAGRGIDRPALAQQQRGAVGEVVLARSVGIVEPGQRAEEVPGLEDIGAHVDFTDLPLGRRRVLLLHDPLEVARGVADNSAQPGGVGRDRRAEQTGGGPPLELREQSRHALRPEHRRVAAHDHHGPPRVRRVVADAVFDGGGGGGHRVPRAALFPLQGEGHAGDVGQSPLHEFGPVPHHDDPVADARGL